MRGRVLRLTNQFKSPLTVAASIGVGFGSGAYLYKLLMNDKEININLPTFTDMREYRDLLKQKFIDVNDCGESQSHTFKALLEAIEINDVVIAEKMLNDLVSGNLLPDHIRDGLIVLAANHSKIKILELLQNVFGEDVVLRNRHARDLLSLTEEEKEKVSGTLEQFYQSPGKINIEGMTAFIHAKQKDLLAENLCHRALQPVYVSSDLAEDIAQSYKQLVSAQKITDELEEKFRRTIIIDLTDYPAFEDIVEDYYRRLAAEATQENKPVVGTMVMTGGHFTIAQIKVLPQPDNFNHAVIVYIDSLGSFLSATTCNYGNISSLPHHVFGNVTLMISEDRNQFAVVGCSLFVCDQYGAIMNLDQIMSRNTQYSFAGNENVIFDYAQHASTIHSKYGYDYSAESGTYAGVNDFTIFVLPACLIVGKQSLESSEVRNDTFDTFVLQPDGRYKYDYDRRQVDTRTSVLGLMGLNRSRLHSSPERQLEFTRPVDISGTATVDEHIAKNLEPAGSQGVGKQRNKRIERLGYEYGSFLGRNIRDVLDVKNHGTEDFMLERARHKQ